MTDVARVGSLAPHEELCRFNATCTQVVTTVVSVSVLPKLQRYRLSR